VQTKRLTRACSRCCSLVRRPGSLERGGVQHYQQTVEVHCDVKADRSSEVFACGTEGVESAISRHVRCHLGSGSATGATAQDGRIRDQVLFPARGQVGAGLKQASEADPTGMNTATRVIVVTSNLIALQPLSTGIRLMSFYHFSPAFARSPALITSASPAALLSPP
jgi:hypothetical protein